MITPEFEDFEALLEDDKRLADACAAIEVERAALDNAEVKLAQASVEHNARLTRLGERVIGGLDKAEFEKRFQAAGEKLGTLGLLTGAKWTPRRLLDAPFEHTEQLQFTVAIDGGIDQANSMFDFTLFRSQNKTGTSLSPTYIYIEALLDVGDVSDNDEGAYCELTDTEFDEEPITAGERLIVAETLIDIAQNKRNRQMIKSLPGSYLDDLE